MKREGAGRRPGSPGRAEGGIAYRTSAREEPPRAAAPRQGPYVRGESASAGSSPPHASGEAYGKPLDERAVTSELPALVGQIAPQAAAGSVPRARPVQEPGAPGTRGTLPHLTPRRALALRVRAHIDRHLGDPGLAPASIAAAHHISLRSLHRLFQGEETTVAGFIRHRRLERVRRDLADPGLLSRPIHAVAGCWGFSRASDLTRAFRAAYGVTPSEYRNSCCGTGVGAQREGTGARC